MNTPPAPNLSADAPTVLEPNPPPFLTVGGVAKIVGRSTTRVKELAAELQLPDIRAGTVRIFLPEHVEKIRAEVLRREREALK